MAIALLIATGLAVCVAVQLVIRQRLLALFVSIVATLAAWIAVGLLFALATRRPLFQGGEWARVEAVLGAALIAQIVAMYLRRLRRHV